MFDDLAEQNFVPESTGKTFHTFSSYPKLATYVSIWLKQNKSLRLLGDVLAFII